MKSRKPMIEEFIGRFTSKRISYEKIRKQYFQVSRQLADTKNQIDRNPFCIGLYLGEEKKDSFFPSSNLMDWLSDNSDRKAFINRKASWLFLCGRMVLPGSIKRMDADSGYVLVQNENDENLGYGKIFKEKGKPMIRTMYDKGSFLRREKQKLK